MNAAVAAALTPWPDRLKFSPIPMPTISAARWRFFDTPADTIAYLHQQRALAFGQMLATLRTAECAVAVERFRAAHGGTLPATLDDLVPAFIDRVPVNLFSGAPLKLRSSTGTYAVYSVGPNFRDDGGTALKAPRKPATGNSKRPNLAPDYGVSVTLEPAKLSTCHLNTRRVKRGRNPQMRLFEDIRYAVRQLTNARAFTAVAVVTLALGIAGSTMFFAAVNAMVFRPIRATRSDGLFVVRYIHKLKSSGPLTDAQFRRLEAILRPPSGESAHRGARRACRHCRARPRRACRRRGRHAGLPPGARPHAAGRPAATAGRRCRGREPGGDRQRSNLAGVVRRRSPGDRARDDCAQRAFVHDRRRRAPRIPGMGGSSYGTADIWITPAAAARAGRAGVQLRLGRYWITFVRPRAGSRPSDVEAAIHSALMGSPNDPPPDQIVIRLIPAAAFIGTDQLTSTGMAIIGLSTLLLIAACANLANMLFARGAQRAGEVAVRMSLGAGRLSIFRLFVIESAIVSGLAACVGLALALGAVRRGRGLLSVVSKPQHQDPGRPRA